MILMLLTPVMVGMYRQIGMNLHTKIITQQIMINILYTTFNYSKTIPNRGLPT